MKPLDWLYDIQGRMLDLVHAGGPVMPAIFAASLLMWMLIAYRYWYLLRAHPRESQDLCSAWHARTDRRSARALSIRDALIDRAWLRLRRGLIALRTLAAALPMLGLLGTVTGMIHTFDVLSMFGAGNARALASGVSEALLTTLTGLVAALSGLYCCDDLERRAERARSELMQGMDIA